MTPQTTVYAREGIMLVYDEAVQVGYPGYVEGDSYYVVYRGRTAPYHNAAEGACRVEGILVPSPLVDWLRDMHRRLCSWVSRRDVGTL